MDYYAKYKKYKNKYKYINLLFGGWFNFDNTQPQKFTYKRHTQSTVGTSTAGHITPGGHELETILNSLYTYFHTNNQQSILDTIVDPMNTFLNSGYAKPPNADINSLHTGNNADDINGGIQRILSTIKFLPDNIFLDIYKLLIISYQKYNAYDNKGGTDTRAHILIRDILNNKLKNCLDRFNRIKEYNVLTSYNFIKNIPKYNKLNNKVSKNQLKILRRIYKSIIIKQLILQGTNLKKTIDDLIGLHEYKMQSDEILKSDSLCYDFLLDHLPQILNTPRDALISNFNQSTSKSTSFFVADTLDEDTLEIIENSDEDTSDEDSLDTDKTALPSKENFSVDDISHQKLQDTISYFKDADLDDVNTSVQKMREEQFKQERRREIQKQVNKARMEQEQQQEILDEKKKKMEEQEKDLKFTQTWYKRAEVILEESKKDNIYKQNVIKAKTNLEKIRDRTLSNSDELIEAQKQFDDAILHYRIYTIKQLLNTQNEIYTFLLETLKPYKKAGYKSDLSLYDKNKIIQHLFVSNPISVEMWKNIGNEQCTFIRDNINIKLPDVNTLLIKMGTNKLIKQFSDWTITWNELSKVQEIYQILDIAYRISNQQMIDIDEIVDDPSILNKNKEKSKGKGKGKKKRK